MLPWGLIFAVIALVTAVFGVAGPVHGASATAQAFIHVYVGLSALLLMSTLLGKSRPFRVSQRGGPFHPGG
jgi:uncharacterized membrane protein YtjA (UPF0391 family)